LPPGYRAGYAAGVALPDARTASPAMDLQAVGLRVEAGGSVLIDGVGLRVPAGQLCGIIGPSGAGKSTLIRVLLGLTEPSRGELRLGGRPIREAGAIGYVPQDDALHGTLTVGDALRFAAELRLHGMPDASREARIRAALGSVGLADRAALRIRKLSGGQRKRVSVAMELLAEPPLLILDEPTSGLDPGLETKSMELFQRVARTGRVVLVSTHAMQSLALCDLLLVLMGGRQVWFGPPAEAPAFFDARDLVDVFHRLGERPAAEWAAAFAARRRTA
jgi:ABC-type multidrug transport system ATPase subunit